MAPKKPPGAKRGNSRKGTPPPPATGTRLASHRTGPWGSQDFTDTLIVSTPPSSTEVANATPDATPAPAAATPTAATPTVTFDPDLYVINTPPASRSGSRHPSPFTRSPLLRGPGHLDEEGYDFHRIVKANKTDETTTTAATTTPSAFTNPIVVGNLPGGITEEMMMEDIRAATGIKVRAQAAGPSASGPSASPTDGLNPDQLREHTAAREAQSAGLHSPNFTEEFERRFEEDRVQAEEDRRLLQNLNSPSPTTPAEADDEPAAEQRPASEPAAEHRLHEQRHRHHPPGGHLPATVGPPEAEGSWAARFDPDLTDAQMFPAGNDDDEDDDADPPPTLVASPPVEPSSPQMLSSSPRMLSPRIPPTDTWEKCDPWTSYSLYESAECADRRRADEAHGPTPTIPPPATPLPPPPATPPSPAPHIEATLQAITQQLHATPAPPLQWTAGKTKR